MHKMPLGEYHFFTFRMRLLRENTVARFRPYRVSLCQDPDQAPKLKHDPSAALAHKLVWHRPGHGMKLVRNGMKHVSSPAPGSCTRRRAPFRSVIGIAMRRVDIE